MAAWAVRAAETAPPRTSRSKRRLFPTVSWSTEWGPTLRLAPSLLFLEFSSLHDIRESCMLVRVASIALLVSASVAACSGDSERDVAQSVTLQPGGSTSSAASAPTNPATASATGAGTSPGSTNATPSASAPATASPQPSAMSSSSSSGAEPEPSAAPSQSPSASSGSGGSDPECTDVKPDDRPISCQQWADYGECESGWLKDPGFCAASCGRCEPGMSMMPASSSTGAMPAPSMSSGGGPGGMGDDNPYEPITNGTNGVTTRYWDCCKPSCSWSGKGGTPVDSCNLSGANIGLNDQVKSVCDGGDGQTCHGMAPFAHSTTLAFGYAAINGATCGQCFQVQFTGAGGSSPSDPGSNAIKGKTMIVMATNIGDIGANHFDLLIPGGGVGQFNGCSKALGNVNLGATRGGYLADCSGDLNAKKECVRQKCSALSNFPDLYDGCIWFVDWFEVADNPNIVYKPVDCPQELRGFN